MEKNIQHDIRSVLEFKGYHIDEFLFKRNKNFKEKENIDVKIKLAVRVTQDESDATVAMVCEIFDDDFSNDDFPFYLKVAIAGDFRCTVPNSKDFFELNGTAILFPYLRAFVTNFTAQAGFPPLILPPINVYKFLERES